MSTYKADSGKVLVTVVRLSVVVVAVSHVSVRSSAAAAARGSVVSSLAQLDVCAAEGAPTVT
jgi:hypothetical protein